MKGFNTVEGQRSLISAAAYFLKNVFNIQIKKVHFA